MPVGVESKEDYRVMRQHDDQRLNSDTESTPYGVMTVLVTSASFCR